MRVVQGRRDRGTAMRVKIGPYTYSRLDREPRKGDRPTHDWLRDRPRAQVSMEAKILVDEVVSVRALLRSVLDADPMAFDSKENYRCSFCLSEDVEYADDGEDTYLHHPACAWLNACDQSGRSHFGHASGEPS